jgi:hypothetical protein
MPAPIEFVCLNPKHPPRRITISGFVTIHDGGWAFCPDAGLEAHQWKHIDPLALSDVVRRLTYIVEGLRRDMDGPLGPLPEVEVAPIPPPARTKPTSRHAVPQ